MYCGSLGFFFFFLKVMALLNSGIWWKEDSVLCVHEEVEMLLISLIRILNYLKCIAAVMWILTHSLEEGFFSVCTWPEVGWETSKQPDCQKRESHWCPVEPKDSNKCCVIGQNSKLLVIGHGSCVCTVFVAALLMWTARPSLSIFDQQSFTLLTKLSKRSVSSVVR